MKRFDKRRAILVVCLAAVGAGGLFLFRLVSISEAPAPRKQAAVQENPDHELKMLTVQLEKKPGHLPVLMRMAQIEHDQGKMTDAVKHLRDAAASEPSNPDVHLELGRILYETGARDEARKETEQALALNPKSVDALYNLGAISANAGDPRGARSYWEKAVALDPASESGKKARDSIGKLTPAASARAAAVH